MTEGPRDDRWQWWPGDGDGGGGRGGDRGGDWGGGRGGDRGGFVGGYERDEHPTETTMPLPPVEDRYDRDYGYEEDFGRGGGETPLDRLGWGTSAPRTRRPTARGASPVAGRVVMAAALVVAVFGAGGIAALANSGEPDVIAEPGRSGLATPTAPRISPSPTRATDPPVQVFPPRTGPARPPGPDAPSPGTPRPAVPVQPPITGTGDPAPRSTESETGAGRGPAGGGAGGDVESDAGGDTSGDADAGAESTSPRADETGDVAEPARGEGSQSGGQAPYTEPSDPDGAQVPDLDEPPVAGRTRVIPIRPQPPEASQAPETTASEARPKAPAPETTAPPRTTVPPTTPPTTTSVPPTSVPPTEPEDPDQPGAPRTVGPIVIPAEPDGSLPVGPIVIPTGPDGALPTGTVTATPDRGPGGDPDRDPAGDSGDGSTDRDPASGAARDRDRGADRGTAAPSSSAPPPPRAETTTTRSAPGGDESTEAGSPGGPTSRSRAGSGAGSGGSPVTSGSLPPAAGRLSALLPHSTLAPSDAPVGTPSGAVWECRPAVAGVDGAPLVGRWFTCMPGAGPDRAPAGLSGVDVPASHRAVSPRPAGRGRGRRRGSARTRGLEVV